MFTSCVLVLHIYKSSFLLFFPTEAEPVLTSAKHDPRLRTVVCRHWLRDLCMKGAACKFLGDWCKDKDCLFRHISKADK